jgi:hypothetical protein
MNVTSGSINVMKPMRLKDIQELLTPLDIEVVIKEGGGVAQNNVYKVIACWHVDLVT